MALPGVYLWLDHLGRVLYIGKSRRLWNRISGHWNGRDGTSFVRRWRRDCEDAGLRADPIVLVWKTDSRASMEAELIERFRPLYARRRE